MPRLPELDDEFQCPFRSSQAAQELLGERFGGVLIADAYASYNGTHPKAWQSCLAHIKIRAKERDQELALRKGRAADPLARQFCQSIQGFVHDDCPAHRQLSRGPWRARAAKVQGKVWRRKLQKVCRTRLHHPRTEKFRQRLLGPEQ